MERPTPCEITPKMEKLWSDTKVALLWHCPAFSHIFYSMLDTVKSKHTAMFTKDVPIAATDGSALLLNPDTFFNYNLSERIFIVSHEIMHCVFNHMGLIHGFKMRGKVAFSDGTDVPYDHQTMNHAMDYVINDLLIQSQVGKYNNNWLHDPSIATAQDSVIDAYRKLYKNKPPQGGNQGQGQGSGQQSFDEHLAPGTTQGKDPTAATQERNDTEWQTQVAAAANAARVQGKLPAALDRMFQEILDPQVDWRDKIQGLFARKVGGGSYNWQKPDRRLIVRDIYAPGRSGFGAGDVVVGVDTSGSIGAKELDMFFAEMAGILEDVRPNRLFVVWCDAKVHRVDEADDPADLYTIRHMGAPGGGGTSFIPVFEWMDEQGVKPDALVYLTDGYGSFPPKEPAFPVIWGNISTPGSVKYPFGDVVDVPKVH